MGKGDFRSPPPRCEIPQPIFTILELYMSPHAKFDFEPMTWAVRETGQFLHLTYPLITQPNMIWY